MEGSPAGNAGALACMSAKHEQPYGLTTSSDTQQMTPQRRGVAG